MLFQHVDNAENVPKEWIIDQLLTSNPEFIPEVDDDDGDQLWEDVTIVNKMVIVINTGLKMGIGKIASQVNKCIIIFQVPSLIIKFKNGKILSCVYYDIQGSMKNNPRNLD